MKVAQQLPVDGGDPTGVGQLDGVGMVPGWDRAMAIRSATLSRSPSTPSSGYVAPVSSSASTPITGPRPSVSSVVPSRSRSASTDTDSSAPWPCNSWAMPVWSCVAVPSRTAPESTELLAARSSASGAVAAANGTRSRSSISGTPARGTTTTRRPLGSVDSCAWGTGCGRGSPSGGTRERSSEAVIGLPR
jgi:hypothetical protein